MNGLRKGSRSVVRGYAVIIAFLLLFAVVLSGCPSGTKTGTGGSTAGGKDGGQPKTVLKLGFVPVMNIEEMVKQFQAVAKYLGRKVDARVKLVPVQNYQQLLEKLATKEIDLGTAGSYIGYRAIKEVKAVPLVRPEQGGISTYKSLIVVRKDSGITNLRQLKGKSFAYVDMNTSAGYIYPRAVLRKMGYDPENFFSKTVLAGKHDAAFLAVFHRQEVGAAAKDLVYNQLVKQNPKIGQELSIIASGGRFPEKPIMARPGMSATMRSRIIKVFLEMNRDAEGRAALEDFGADRFIRTTVEDFASVDELAKELQR